MPVLHSRFIPLVTIFFKRFPIELPLCLPKGHARIKADISVKVRLSPIDMFCRVFAYMPVVMVGISFPPVMVGRFQNPSPFVFNLCIHHQEQGHRQKPASPCSNVH